MRRALLVANDVYEHEGLRQLHAPAADVQALSQVLGDPAIGDFEVDVLRNEPAHVIQGRIEDLFADSRREDLLLLHFSCHGLKSESGELFFAARNTRPDRLGSTAVSADFVQRTMRACRAGSIVLLLDCCYGGAFSQGVTVRATGDVRVLDSFPSGELGGGRGRAVITASSAMEYAFEGQHLADDHSGQPSVFTAALVDGLATGEADRDQDGWISLDELYDHVFDRVRSVNPHQTPSRDVEMQGELYLARGRTVVTPSPLPTELQDVVDHPLPGIRVGAVQELDRLARGPHAGLRLAAELALRRLAEDDSRMVAAAATASLGAVVPTPTTPGTATPGTTVSAGSGRQPDTAPEVVPAGSGPAPAGPAASRPALPLAPLHRRRSTGLAALAVVLALGGAAALLLRDDPSAGDRVLPPGPFTATAPWRLVVKDHITGVDDGCLVTLARADGGAEVVSTSPAVYGTRTYQVRASGRFTWTANDPGCLVSVRNGAGDAALPFAHLAGGDTDAFASPDRVAVTVQDANGNNGCEIELHDADDGQLVAFEEVGEGDGVLLDPSGRPRVYVTNLYCDVRISAGAAAAG